MVKTAFNIKYRPQIESGEYEVVTREDRPIDIIKWDLKGDFPIIGVYYDEKNNREIAVQVTAEGRCSVTPGEEYGDDFFIITDESELTEFEGKLITKEQLLHKILPTFFPCGYSIYGSTEEVDAWYLGWLTIEEAGYIPLEINLDGGGSTIVFWWWNQYVDEMTRDEIVGYIKGMMKMLVPDMSFDRHQSEDGHMITFSFKEE